MTLYARKYQGYTIQPASIWKDGEPIVMFYSPLDATEEEIFQQAKNIIDEIVAQKK